MLPTPLEFLSSSGLIALLTSLLSGGGGLALGVIIGVLVSKHYSAPAPVLALFGTFCNKLTVQLVLMDHFRNMAFIEG